MRGPSGPKATYVITCTPRRWHERDPRVLDAAVAVAPFPHRFRLEHDAAALDADRDAVLDDDLGEADP